MHLKGWQSCERRKGKSVVFCGQRAREGRREEKDKEWEGRGVGGRGERVKTHERTQTSFATVT